MRLSDLPGTHMAGKSRPDAPKQRGKRRTARYQMVKRGLCYGEFLPDSSGHCDGARHAVPEHWFCEIQRSEWIFAPFGWGVEVQLWADAAFVREGSWCGMFALKCVCMYVCMHTSKWDVEIGSHVSLGWDLRIHACMCLHEFFQISEEVWRTKLWVVHAYMPATTHIHT